jgi:hypothetical protein
MTTTGPNDDDGDDNDDPTTQRRRHDDDDDDDDDDDPASRPLCTVALCFYPPSVEMVAAASFEDYAETFRVMGTLCFRLSDWMFLLLLILLAKGWTIVRRSISAQSQMRVALFLCLNLVAVVFSVVMDAFAQRTVTLRHYWATGGGVAVLVLQLLFYFWFVSNTLHTLGRFKKQKSRFYIKFFLFYSGWTLVMPALMLILSQILDASAARGVLYVVHLIFAFFFTHSHPRTHTHAHTHAPTRTHTHAHTRTHTLQDWLGHTQAHTHTHK